MISFELKAEQPEQKTTKTDLHFEIGTDISPWLLGGSSVITMVGKGSFRVGLEFWRFEFPNEIIDGNSKNKGEGWSRKVDKAYALYGDYFLKTTTQEAWFVGVVMSTFHSTVKRQDFPEEDQFWSSEVLGRVGYKYKLNEKWSLNPWMALGPLKPNTPDRKAIGGEEFNELPYQFIATIHLNYEI